MATLRINTPTYIDIDIDRLFDSGTKVRSKSKDPKQRVLDHLHGLDADCWIDRVLGSVVVEEITVSDEEVFAAKRACPSVTYRERTSLEQAADLFEAYIPLSWGDRQLSWAV